MFSRKTKIEDNCVGVTKDFVRALLMSAHYVFNVAYAPEIEGTMIFIQKLILELADSVKPPAKVFSLISKVKKNTVIYDTVIYATSITFCKKIRFMFCLNDEPRGCAISRCLCIFIHAQIIYIVI